MKYRVTVKRLRDGQYYARCDSGPWGKVERTAASEEAALAAVRAEIEYDLEWCPCTGAARESVELDVRQG
jgi:hypothetical protein